MIRKSALKQLLTPTCGLVSTVLCVSVMTSHSPPTQAAIFKCTDADGSVSYSQSPCPTADQKQKVMPSSASNHASPDCRIANNFARRTVSQMRAGQSSGELFDLYGGIDALPRTAIGVINYVYSLKDNHDTSEQRITALSAARCSNGSYGRVSCDDFPYAFVSELGGCNKAAQSTMSAARLIADNPTQTEAESSASAGTAALGVKTASDNTDKPSVDNKCTRVLQAQIQDVINEMQNGQDVQDQLQMEQKKLTLQDKLGAC